MIKYGDCIYCLERKMIGVTVERLRGELNVCRNSNRQYRKIIKDLVARLNELELELEYSEKSKPVNCRCSTDLKEPIISNGEFTVRRLIDELVNYGYNKPVQLVVNYDGASYIERLGRVECFDDKVWLKGVRE